MRCLARQRAKSGLPYFMCDMTYAAMVNWKAVNALGYLHAC